MRSLIPLLLLLASCTNSPRLEAQASNVSRDIPLGIPEALDLIAEARRTDPSTPEDAALLVDDERRGLEALRADPETAAAHIGRRIAGSAHEDARQGWLILLGEVGGEEATRLLIEETSRTEDAADPELRGAIATSRRLAIGALSRVAGSGGRTAHQHLERIAVDPSSSLTPAAIDGLFRIDPEPWRLYRQLSRTIPSNRRYLLSSH